MGGGDGYDCVKEGREGGDNDFKLLGESRRFVKGREKREDKRMHKSVPKRTRTGATLIPYKRWFRINHDRRDRKSIF